MTAQQIIKMALAYKGQSEAELARKLGWSPQLLNKRLKTGKFSLNEWDAIAAALGAEFACSINFPDKKIEK